MKRYNVTLQCGDTFEVECMYNPFEVEWECKVNDQHGYSSVLVAVRIQGPVITNAEFQRLINRRPDNASKA